MGPIPRAIERSKNSAFSGISAGPGNARCSLTDHPLLLEDEHTLVEDDVAILVHRLEETGIAVDPHRDIEIVSRHYGFREAALHRFEARRVGTAYGVEQRSAGHAVRAQTMKNRPVEAAHLREGRIGMQRISIAREAVKERLVDSGLVAQLVIRLAIWQFEGR